MMCSVTCIAFCKCKNIKYSCQKDEPIITKMSVVICILSLTRSPHYTRGVNRFSDRRDLALKIVRIVDF